ncbi:hypothetical protein [Streptomyces sp. NPDC059631]|uniref:hypothetical protein n=1 Tax=unclassified Streptomyces TaxID=2593676 RepID=UPI00368B27A8
MARIWVLTQPSGSGRQEIIRADVITSVSGDADNVLAIRSDTRAVISLAVGSGSSGRRKPLPNGFHVSFLQALDSIKPSRANLDVILMASWVVDQEEWQWITQDIEDLAPEQF